MPITNAVPRDLVLSFVTLLLVAAAPWTTGRAGAQTLPSGLIGAWVGAGGTGTSLTDSSGYGHNGTIAGATWVAGRNGQALNFTGAGVASVGDLDLPGSFSVTTWMQTRSLYPGTCASLVMKALDYGFELCGGRLAAKVGSGGSWSARVSKSFTSADLNTWKHVALTYDGGRLRFYIGGVLIGSATGSHTTTNIPLLFGRWISGGYWNGLIDEVRIYGRALSQAEIQADMSGTATSNVAPAISLTTPVGGATFTAPATIALAATATDRDGSVAKVAFYNGTTLIGTDTTSPYTYSWTGVAAGTYGVKAIATDNAGARTTSTTATITVATSGSVNIAPSVSMTAPATGTSFLVGATVPLSATASDSDGTIKKVEFYLGSLLLATDTTSPYSTTWPAVLGSFSVSAVATDDKGARTVSAWRDFVVTASTILGKAVFEPVTPLGAADYYVLEIFPAGANPNTAAPVATQNLGLPAVVAGECSADVRTTIVGLAPGSYIATVVSMGPGGKLRSNTFSFTR